MPVACQRIAGKRQVACRQPAGCLPGHLPRSGAVAATREGCIELAEELPLKVSASALPEVPPSVASAKVSAIEVECCVGLCVCRPRASVSCPLLMFNYRLSLSLRVAISVKVSMLYPPKGAGVRVLNLPVILTLLPTLPNPLPPLKMPSSGLCLQGRFFFGKRIGCSNPSVCFS